MIKKLLSLLLSLVLFLSFASCVKNKDDKETLQTVKISDYSDNVKILIHAWDFPLLEYSVKDGYDTEKNRLIMLDAKAAGFDVMHIHGINSNGNYPKK